VDTFTPQNPGSADAAVGVTAANVDARITLAAKAVPAWRTVRFIANLFSSANRPGQRPDRKNINYKSEH
jgi:hypothetical protein